MQEAVSRQPQTTAPNDFNLDRELPENLVRLDDISSNFYWSWQPDGTALFRDISPDLWVKCEQNPRVFLSKVDPLLLAQRSADPAYVERLNNFAAKFDRYISESPATFGIVAPATPAAYFCAEYGVHNSLPNYSGGLGILAGDHLKSASDLNVPLVAIGLLYRFGYFRQNIGHDGWQEEAYSDVFDSKLAVTPVTGDDGQRIAVAVHIRGREVYAQVWLARVGRISLYLLDTNVPQNAEVDRLITGHLYGGDAETRIVQEKVLGIGGVRLLRTLSIEPSVYHLNEGHSAFLTLELAHEFLAANPSATFDDAVKNVREKCVFTTHTPVDAGNDAFDPATLQACFSSEYIDSLKISRDTFFDLGRTNPENDAEFFGMTPLAIRMCRAANGVSEKHGEVSRNLWLKMFPELSAAEDVPIKFVTNGVHAPTWIAPVFQELFSRQFGSDWHTIVRDSSAWAAAVESIPDSEIWAAHRTQKELLVAFIRERTRSHDTGATDTINERANTENLFSPTALTIGFARRVAAYKRWDLIVSDIDRLLRLVDDPDRPVQFVFAGKAHPQDNTAKTILQNLMSINHDSHWQKRAVFIEDYDQEVARYLVHGVDVWMNVPRRPLEASGTSGMKAAMNGALNFSVLDGWWIEGYNNDNGFAIGGLVDGSDDNTTDAEDAEALYSTLENVIVPAFHSDGDDGIPQDWIRRMKNSIATLTPMFSSDRMVKDYIEKVYNASTPA
ncbi:MAG: alpha-glucan family phosphorylase [Acidobacteriota bacterium]